MNETPTRWKLTSPADATAADEGGSPCHLYGYGSYGICIDPTFSATRLALVDRGVLDSPLCRAPSRNLSPDERGALREEVS